MKIVNHILTSTHQAENIVLDKSPNMGAAFKDNLPDTIVIHYTAGGSLSSSVSWLKNKEASASAHIVIGKNGKIVQLVPFNRIAWHAGRSKWKGRSGMNSFSLGIELDNAGVLQKRNTGYYTHFGKKINENNVVLAQHKHGNSEQAWETFTEKQLDAVQKICAALKTHYGIQEIVGHEDISKGRKIDPGPAFPLQKIQQKIMEGRADEDAKDDQLDNKSFYGKVTASKLNMRNKPSATAEKVGSISKSTEVKVLKKKGNWYRIAVQKEAWVSAKYVSLKN